MGEFTHLVIRSIHITEMKITSLSLEPWPRTFIWDLYSESYSPLLPFTCNQSEAWNRYLEHLGTISAPQCAGNYFGWLGKPYMQETTNIRPLVCFGRQASEASEGIKSKSRKTSRHGALLSLLLPCFHTNILIPQDLWSRGCLSLVFWFLP